MTHAIDLFLRSIGAKKRNAFFVLDEWDNDIYLWFDSTDNPERPDTWGTCNIFVEEVGKYPHDSEMLLKEDCTVAQVVQFLLGMGLDRFSEKTQEAVNLFKTDNQS